MNGYLKAIAIFSITNVVNLPADNFFKFLFEAAIVPRVFKIFSDFDRLDLLTLLDEKRFILNRQIDGEVFVSIVLMSNIDLFKCD